MANIQDRPTFERWLEGKPREWAVALATRAALRVLPFAFEKKDVDEAQEPLIQASLRTMLTSGVASTWPTPDVSAAAYAADAADAARADAVWRAIQADATALERNPQQDLFALPLWPEGDPDFIRQRWAIAARSLRATAPHWKVWIDWYEDRLAGSPLIREIHETWALLSEEDWDKGPAHVNPILARIEEEYRAKQRGEGKAEPPAIPAQKAAALQPVWRDGTLTLPEGSAQSDLTAERLAANLQALKEEMHDLIAEAREVPNHDKRFVDSLERFVGRLPSEAPDQVALFRLGHSEEAFLGYIKKVNEEWPDFLAARYLSLIQGLDRTLRQFPAWREFKRNADKDKLTADDKAIVPELAEVVVEALRSDDLKAFVDHTVPDAVEVLSNDLSAAQEEAAAQADASAVVEDLYLDIVESINNTLKRLSEPVSEFVRGLREKVGKENPSERSQNSIAKEIGRQADNLGPNLTKAVKKILGLVYQGGKIGGSVYIVLQFEWFRHFVDWLVKLLP